MNFVLRLTIYCFVAFAFTNARNWVNEQTTVTVAPATMALPAPSARPSHSIKDDGSW